MTNVAVLGTSPLLPILLLVVGAPVAWRRRKRTGARLGILRR
jgi:MYXO-CTERM domain-containing protein